MGLTDWFTFNSSFFGRYTESRVNALQFGYGKHLAPLREETKYVLRYLFFKFLRVDALHVVLLELDLTSCDQEFSEVDQFAGSGVLNFLVL